MKKLLNPLIVSVFIVTMLLGSIAHLMYGSCQSSKWHYIMQRYYMPDYLPTFVLGDYSKRVKDTLKDSGVITTTSILKFEPFIISAKGFALYVPKNYTGIWRTRYLNGEVRCEYLFQKGKLVKTEVVE